MTALTISPEVAGLTAEIKVYKAQTGACLIEIGRRLIRAKELLPHGDWLPWLEQEVEFSERTAQNFMRVAKEFGANPQPVADLGMAKVLSLLALPEEERETFAARPHEVNGTRKTVAEMSKRELDAAIKAQKQAENALTAEKQKREAAEDKLAKARADARKAEQAADAAAAREKELDAKLDELRAAAKAAPIPAEVVPDEVTLARIRREVADEMAEQVRAAEQRAAEAQALAEKAKNPLTVKIKLMFDGVQADLSGLGTALFELRAQQPDTADKFAAAIAQYLTAFAGKIEVGRGFPMPG